MCCHSGVRRGEVWCEDGEKRCVATTTRGRSVLPEEAGGVSSQSCEEGTREVLPQPHVFGGNEKKLRAVGDPQPLHAYSRECGEREVWVVLRDNQRMGGGGPTQHNTIPTNRRKERREEKKRKEKREEKEEKRREEKR